MQTTLSRLSFLLSACASLSLAPAAIAAERQDRDTDGDSLSDIAEKQKYFTDPAKADSDGDGMPDGHPAERREYAYSIRTLIRVLKPYDLKAMNDDYQDATLIKETAEYGEIEVIHYPLNNVGQAITPNPHWQSDCASMQDWLRPGLTTNWTPQMRTQLLAELASEGIRPGELTDHEVAKQVSRWMLQRIRPPASMFTTYFIDFSGEKPALLSGCEKAFEREKGTMGWTFEQQLQHEAFGAGMFEHKTRGTCTSSAVCWTTIFRALGLPARQVLCIPAADVNDPAQIEMIRRGITHHAVRKTILEGMEGLSGFVAHTFNEVFIGGRWVRLNYSKLGQNILDEKLYGLLTHTLTFRDLSEAGLSPTWGRRYALGQRSAALPTSNPFTALEVSDLIGTHAQILNPPVKPLADHAVLTFQRLIWADSPQRPAWLTLEILQSSTPERVLILARPAERFADQNHRQYRRFMDASDPSFVLKGADGTEIPARLTQGFYTTSTECEIALYISANDRTRMKPGVSFTLVPHNQKDPARQWAVQKGTTLTAPSP